MKRNPSGLLGLVGPNPDDLYNSTSCCI